MENNDSIFRYSNIASGIGRQIVFAFIIIAWGILYNSKEQIIHFHLLPIIAVLTSMVYLGLDLLQYFIASLSLRKLYQDYIYGMIYAQNENEKKEVDKQKYINSLKIEKGIFKYYIAKFAVLAINLLIIITHFVIQL